MKSAVLVISTLALTASTALGVQDKLTDQRVLQAKTGLTPDLATDGALAVFSIAQTLGPLLPGMFGSGKDCHQIACWVATTTETCAWTAANQVQRELMRGRNSFSSESSSEHGMWVRYWRTQFNPPDTGAVADGTCGGGTNFTVSNCQRTGKVYC